MTGLCSQIDPFDTPADPIRIRLQGVPERCVTIRWCNSRRSRVLTRPGEAVHERHHRLRLANWSLMSSPKSRISPRDLRITISNVKRRLAALLVDAEAADDSDFPAFSPARLHPVIWTAASTDWWLTEIESRYQRHGTTFGYSYLARLSDQASSTSRVCPGRVFGVAPSCSVLAVEHCGDDP